MKKNTNNILLKLKKWIIIYLIYTLIFNGILLHHSFSQEKSNQKVLEGINFFWNAEFEQAIETLRNAIDSKMLNKEELFCAYLYIGFCLHRKGELPEKVEKELSEAIKINPKFKPDPVKIPPDLQEKFEEVRKKITGTVHIITNLPGATIILNNHKVKIERVSPYTFTTVNTGSYDVLLSKKGYIEKKIKIDVIPSKTDTINIVLDKKFPSFYKRGITWISGGTIIIVALLLLNSNKQSSENKPALSDLPAPPERPIR